ncbi:hypothetical protein PIB30_039845 [Stylosanthes scabra]|uniref:Uncharacterized protein n=1 Tax=Stylosanthes scabra TaxID=79078 RepID=A0ABU6TGK7_9FABA|nr:hypothetical protein [Stylosanthes scabra]
MGWGFSFRILSGFSGTGSSLESWRSVPSDSSSLVSPRVQVFAVVVWRTRCSRNLLDSALGDSLQLKTPDEAMDLIELNKAMAQQVTALNKKLKKLDVSAVGTQSVA